MKRIASIVGAVVALAIPSAALAGGHGNDNKGGTSTTVVQVQSANQGSATIQASGSGAFALGFGLLGPIALSSSANVAGTSQGIVQKNTNK